MPFAISGNVSLIREDAVKSFAKNFGIILSDKQFERQQYQLIQNALIASQKPSEIMKKMDKKELISFIFLLTQFGDIIIEETPRDYLYFENNPYVLQWSNSSCMIPLEILEFLSRERMFREQRYLFALLPLLTVKEKKEWIKWIGIDFQGEYEKDLNHELYANLRTLQKVFNGKSLVNENEFPLEKIWPRGKNEIMDWFYKGIASFYYTMHEMSKTEKDPFLVHVIELIKSGKYILLRDYDRFSGEEKFTLTATIEGYTPQLRDKRFDWEIQKEKQKNELFQSV